MDPVQTLAFDLAMDSGEFQKDLSTYAQVGRLGLLRKARARLVAADRVATASKVATVILHVTKKQGGGGAKEEEPSKMHLMECVYQPTVIYKRIVKKMRRRSDKVGIMTAEKSILQCFLCRWRAHLNGHTAALTIISLGYWRPITIASWKSIHPASLDP